MPKAECPPTSIQAEEAVLGCLLLDSAAVSAVYPFLTASDFYRLAHQKVYEACVAVHRRGDPVNQVLVAHELGQSGQLEPVGGHAFLAQLVATVPTPQHAAHYARIVKTTALTRQLIGLSSLLAQRAYNGFNTYRGRRLDNNGKLGETLLWMKEELRKIGEALDATP